MGYNSLDDVRVQVRVDVVRGCGKRKPGGVYLVGPVHSAPCCKLPIPLADVVPFTYYEKPSLEHQQAHLLVYNWVIENSTVQPSQSHRFISQPDIFWKDDPCISFKMDVCPMAIPGAIPNALLIWVGEMHYSTADDFSREAKAHGVSRRLRGIPASFVLGETWVLLAHRFAMLLEQSQVDYTGKPITHLPAIFQVYKPAAIEQVVTGEETEEEVDEMIARGITPIKVQIKGETDEGSL